jgi:CheY-like chemotaxis protein
VRRDYRYPQISQSQVVRFEDWLSMMHWHDRRRVNQACDPEGGGELKMRLQLIDPGGAIRHVLVRGRVFFRVVNYTGSKPIRKAVRLLGIVRYLSDRHLYQRALAESDQRLRWALQHAPIPILIHSDDGQVIELNRDNVRPSADEKGVRLIRRVDSSVVPSIAMYGDPVRLEQVLLNLLVNAIKFTDSRGKIEVDIEASDSLIRLIVADTGIGIESEFLARLFDRFSQADESLRKDRGLGLGLTISRHIVELHGGRIFVASEGLGKGAAFTIELPIASVQMAAPPEKSVLPNDRAEPLRTLEAITIVAVDDNGDARRFVDQILRLHGATVVTVDTGAKAIEAVLRHHPDLVLCDLMMPEMDGYAVLRHIRALRDKIASAVPVVALTAFAGAENRLKTQQAGFQIHLDKPIDPPRLIETIQALVRSSR